METSEVLGDNKSTVNTLQRLNKYSNIDSFVLLVWEFLIEKRHMESRRISYSIFKQKDKSLKKLWTKLQ